MAKRIAVNSLNGSTIDIMNVIRMNAPYEYQQEVPEVTSAHDIPIVGEVILGTPAHANYYLNALINRIVLFRLQSATFNNPYEQLKKGYLEFGETIEDVFVGIAKVIAYDPEKAKEREFARTIPDVRSAFHIMNWRVLYPVTIQDEDLHQAFLSMEGMQNLIAKIVEQVYTAYNYDEFLLFKYLIIKAVAKNECYFVHMVAGDTNERLNYQAEAFRGYSNLLLFMKDKFNAQGVLTTTPRDRQVIFMDAMYNAKFDVEELSAAFHMEKADFMGRLHLIDDFTTFDNKRWAAIREESDMVEEVTQDELDKMSHIKAILFDENWFQVYDNNNKFTENYLGSTMYWNYWYHVWKTVSYSPFANMIAFVDDGAAYTAPRTVEMKITQKVTADGVTQLTIEPNNVDLPVPITFLQTEALTANGISVQKYGVYTIPENKETYEFMVEFEIDDTYKYKATPILHETEHIQQKIKATDDVGKTFTCTKE